ncbi:MAG: hypothetical protein SVM86_04060 [Candidatus Cloacimonadota bacterium]|nr:hypothetical protein [Candidatus Cloacimonadota bacterium]
MRIKIWLAVLIFLMPFLFGKVYNLHNITVDYSNTKFKYVKQIAADFSNNIFEFHRKLGKYPDLPIKIIIAADEKDYTNYTSSKARIIEFSQAFYRDGIIYMRNPADLQNFNRIHKIMLHEYIHHFVHHFFRNAPLWFHEGMAVYFSDDMSFDREFIFMRNHFLGTSLSLNEMKYRYPENRSQWQAFYTKSALAVKYLATKERKKFVNFWHLAKPKSNFLDVFTKSFYYSPAEFSDIFEKNSKTRFIYGILITFSSLIWLILPLILLIGWFRKYLHGKKLQKMWELEQEDISGEKNERI